MDSLLRDFQRAVFTVNGEWLNRYVCWVRGNGLSGNRIALYRSEIARCVCTSAAPMPEAPIL